MKKNKKKLTIIISVAVVLAVAMGAILAVALYNTILKPKDFKNITVSTGDNTGYYRHNFEELNDNEKQLYGAIISEIYSQPKRIEVPELKNGDLTEIFKALSYDNPDLFNIGLNCKIYKKGNKTYFEADYSLEKDDYYAKYGEARKIIDAIVSDASQFTSAYEKEKYVHDYIINHCTYVSPDESANANNIYGCLVEGKASCEGYSRSFQFIMSLLNIDNRLVTGESADDGINFIGHMWNIVTIEGESYFVDLTWDDPKSEGSVLRHTYFNVTTRDIQIKHRNIEQRLPLCTSTKYNYFVYENAYFTVGSGETFESQVLSNVTTAVQRKLNSVELRFASTAIMEQAKNTLFNVGAIYTIYKDAGILDDLSQAKVYYSSDNKTNTICIFI